MAEKSPLLDSDQISYYSSTCQEETVILSATETAVLFSNKHTYWKNLLILSLSIAFVQTSFVALLNIESTINQESGLGVISLACIYASAVVFGTIAPLIVRLVEPKKCLVAGSFAHLVFVGVNAFPRFYTLIPASVFLGALGAIMWTAQASYLTSLAGSYAAFQKGNMANSIARFNGVFFFFYQNPQVWGNLMSSAVLSSSGNHDLSEQPDNVTRVCGIGYCNIEEVEMSPREQELPLVLYILVAVLGVCDVLGIILLFCFMDDIAVAPPSQKHSITKSVLGTVHHHTNKSMLLLLPFFLFNGLGQAFLASEYTQAFPGCTLGLGSIGYVMVSFGVADACSSLMVGRLEKYFSRVFFFTMAALLNLSVLVIMILWEPTSTSQVMFYVLPAMWGIADGIWQPMTCSFLGLTFLSDLEITFALFRMWQSLGYVAMFGMSYFVCMATKVTIVTGVLLLGMCLYYVVEVDLKKGKK